MPESARLSWRTRVALRLSGRPSADGRAIQARLDRALLIASTERDEQATSRPRPVQIVGEAHADLASYRRWRERQLRRIPGATVPELRDGEWALVLWALRPASLVDFARHGRTKGLLTPPYVGRFRSSVHVELGLAGTLAGWLEGQDRGVRLAPPLLHDADGPYRLVTLDRDWELPATELLPALPG